MIIRTIRAIWEALDRTGFEAHLTNLQRTSGGIGPSRVEAKRDYLAMLHSRNTIAY